MLVRVNDLEDSVAPIRAVGANHVIVVGRHDYPKVTRPTPCAEELVLETERLRGDQVLQRAVGGSILRGEGFLYAEQKCRLQVRVETPDDVFADGRNPRVAAEEEAVEHDYDALPRSLCTLQHESGADRDAQTLDAEREPIEDVLVRVAVALSDVVEQVFLELGPPLWIVERLDGKPSPRVQVTRPHHETGGEVNVVELSA